MADRIEEQYLYNLALARKISSELERISQLASKVSPPSKLKLAIFLLIALVLDILDWLELTVVGLLLSYPLKIISAPVLFLHGWFARYRIQKMIRVVEELGEALPRAGARASFRIAKFKKPNFRNPFAKNAWAVAADFVPGLDLMFWRTLGVYLIYRDEKITYKETMAAIEAYQETKLEELQTVLAETTLTLKEQGQYQFAA